MHPLALLTLGAVLLLGWGLVNLFKRIRHPNNNNRSNSDSGQVMVACSLCDTHIPESEAVIKNGKVYCSEEHAE